MKNLLMTVSVLTTGLCLTLQALPEKLPAIAFTGKPQSGQDNNVYGTLLQEYNVSRIRKLNKERSARIDALKNRADAEAYIQEVRKKISGSFDLPVRKTLPPAQITGVLNVSGCRIEKIILDSRENFPVTALLYLPEKVSEPLPAVLYLCGHSSGGVHLNNPGVSGLALTMAKNGFVVLAVDPIGQGERHQFRNVPGAGITDGFTTLEHNMLGKQLWLTDEFFGSWRVHDALSALDYLLSRPEVDPAHVGVTGNSGGGTLSAFVNALDPRITMAAPSCYVTSWQRNIENELPVDAEQMPPGLAAAGCEMGDLILSFAPRPVLLLGQKDDFFDAEGIKETFEECRKVYRLLGKEENIQLFIGPTFHTYSPENRFAMYKFFHRLAGIKAFDGKEFALPQTVTAQNLFCTPDGEVGNLPGKKLVHDLLVEKLDHFAAGRKKTDLAGIRKLLIEKYGFPAAVPEPYCRTLRASVKNFETDKEFVYSKFALETEPGILTALLLKTPEKKRDFYHFPAFESLTLYVPHLSSADELQHVEVSSPVAGVDVRGSGMAFPLNCGDSLNTMYYLGYVMDYHYCSTEILFASSSLNGRVRDLLGAVAFAKARGVKNIRIAGRGHGAVVALFAAILSDDIDFVTLYDAPESFDSMARSRITLWPHSLMLRGILRYTDLPEMYGILQEMGKLKVVNYVDNFFNRKKLNNNSKWGIQ